MIKKQLIFRYLLLASMVSSPIASLSPLFAESTKNAKVNPDMGYTINFDNVSIKEFVKFISKIAGINVIYNEEDLNFNVTIVSEGETNLENIMSALVQILRIHGLTLIEEQQNLIIHRNASVKQIPTVVSEENPLNGKIKPPIITRVFKIKKGDPSHIASLIIPMLSSDALVEVSMETMQIIVTDVASSIDTVESLLLSLDAPNTPYDVEAYTARNVSPEALATLAAKIIRPLSESTQIELVAQPDTGTLYIVSTPFLIERTLAVLKDLDKEASGISEMKKLSTDNVLIYRLQYRSADEVESGLLGIAKQAQGQGFTSAALESTIMNMKYVKAMNSLMFVGPPQDLGVIESFLKTIDSPEGGFGYNNPAFYLFEPSGISLDESKIMIKEIGEHLKKSSYARPGLITALENAQMIPAPVNAILFTGDLESINELKSLMSSIEHSYETETKRIGPSRFFLYNIKEAHEEQIRQSLNHLADYLEANKYPNPELIEAIDSMRWIKATNSLMFTGHAKALQELVEILPTFDVPPERSKTVLSQIPPSSDFVIYTPKSAPVQYLKEATQEMARNLKASDLADPAFLKAIESGRILPTTNQLIYTGDKESLDRVQTVLQDLDSDYLESSARETLFFIPTANAEQMKISLNSLAQELPKGDPIATMIKHMRILPSTNVLVFRGSAETMSQIKEAIDLTQTNAVNNSATFVHLQNRTAKDMVVILHDLATKLSHSKNSSQSLIQTLSSAQAMENAYTLIISGSPENIAQVQEIITANDLPGKIPGSEIYVYKLKYLSSSELKLALAGIAEHANAHQPTNDTEMLQKTISSMRPIPDSSAVQFVGSPETLAKLKEILLVLDTSEHAKSAISPTSNFLVYNVRHANPQTLLSHLKQMVSESSAFLKDETLLKSVRSGRYAPDSHALIFTGNKHDLDKIQDVLQRLDVSEGPTHPNTNRKAEGYKIYRPKYVSGLELIQMLKNFEQHLVSSGVMSDELAETIDHLSYVNRTNMIIVTGYDKDVSEVITLLEEFDNQAYASGRGSSLVDSDIEQIDETGFLIYKLQYQPGDSIVQALSSISQDLTTQKNQKKNETLIEAIQSVQWIDITNSLIATGDPKVLTRVKELITSIDRPLRQVFIEILVLEVTMADQFDFGLRWSSQGTVANRVGWGTGNFSPTDAGVTTGFPVTFPAVSNKNPPQGVDIPPIPGGYLGAIGDVIWHKGTSYASLGSLLNALQATNETTVVLSQKIIVQDNQNAKIFAGENVPFTGSLVTTAGLSQTTNANLEYRNIGVTVSLTPIIGDNGTITLDIDHEISEEENVGQTSSSVTSNALNGIRTSKSSVQTKIHMPDRHFVALSGSMKNSTGRTASGIPCLGGLPLIGAAFSEITKTTTNTNLIIFIKPHIIDSPETHIEITKNQEEIFGQRPQANPEDFHRGLELVRSPDDADASE